VRIDGYVEIGFGGFSSVVDSLAGVDICVARAMKDPFAGINLKAGCQTLNGPNALGYVRARHSDPLGDIGRAQRQREFLGAIMHKAASPSTVLIPWRYYGFATTAGASLTVGENTSLRDVTRVLQAMRSASSGEGLSLTVPVSNPALPTRVGSAVKWDSPKATELFNAIKNDTPLTVAPAGSGK
jgi:anionic cell wall polymer biosynthesis LytR-Cps2A-Psr (LCP) family protein